MDRSEIYNFLNGGIPTSGIVKVITSYRIIVGVLITINLDTLVIDTGTVTELVSFDNIILLEPVAATEG